MGILGTQTSAAPRGKAGAQPPANPILNFMPMIVICAILYMLVIRPQQKQAKEHRTMVDSFEKRRPRADRKAAFTARSVSLKGSIVQVKIADNVKVEVARTAITQVIVENTNGRRAVDFRDRLA